MTARDLLSEVTNSLAGNKARSGLTILGIVIGISSVIVLVAVGQGATASVTSSISSLGSNLLIVSPGAARNAGPVSGGAGSAQSLTTADADAMKKEVSSAKALAVELSRRYQITAKGNNTNTQVVGTESTYTEVRNVSVEEGDFLTDQEEKSVAKVAVLGPTTRDNLFGQGAEAIGQTIKINQIQFKVIGITKAKGGSGFTNPDDAVYVPLSSAQRYLAGRTAISSIDIEAQDAASVQTANQEVTDLLLNRHHIDDPTLADFSVLNQTDVVASLSSVTGTLTLLLGAISGISLLVGGIGIMNMMLTSVTERTREIGLRKAIGARKFDISLQFLAEAVSLTVLGGLIGVALGYGLAVLINRTGAVHAQVTWSSIGLACGVSALVGIVFGYYPARRAAQLSPIEALKYE